MPGERCAVACCNNSRVKTRNFPVENKIFYFRFPKDPILSKEWVQRCYRANTCFNPKTSVICSEHFTNDDYERDLKAELLKITPSRVLKPCAVPSVNVGSKCDASAARSRNTYQVSTSGKVRTK